MNIEELQEAQRKIQEKINELQAQQEEESVEDIISNALGVKVEVNTIESGAKGKSPSGK